jgi:putative endopeptidase
MPTKKLKFNIQRPNVKTLKVRLNKFQSFETPIGIDDNPHSRQELIKLLNTPFSPLKYTPKNDFYSYINNEWIDKKTKIIKKVDKYYVQIDSFRIVQETVYYQLMDMVKEYTKTNHSKQSKLINNVYKSFISLDHKMAQMHVDKTVDDINKYIDGDNMLGLLAYVNNNEVVSFGCPISWGVRPDEKNAAKFISYISAPQLPLYDYNLYTEYPWDKPSDKKYKKYIKKEYLKYIDELFDSCLGKNHGFKSIDIFNIEVQLLDASGCTKAVKVDNDDYYNKVTAEESLTKYKFDWNAFAKALGFKSVPKTFIVTSLNYFKCGMELLLKNWKTPEWKGYWIYIYLKQIVRFSSKWWPIHYNFFAKTTQGQSAPFYPDIYPVFGVSVCFNKFLTDQYIEKNRQQEVIDFVQTLGDDLKIVFMRIINRNKWLSQSTKKYALLKLKHLKFMIGSPEVTNDPLLSYIDNDPWGNLLKISEWRAQNQIRLEGKDVVDISIVDWAQTPFKLVSQQSYVVNAFYTPTQNSIYIPQAYMQRPFVDLNERGIEYNLAFIGYTLGHEMSHSLDNTGSKYDYKGNLHNWWTPHDRKIFNTKVKDIIKQYETFASYDGLKMDASGGVGEDMADISGLAICMEYLRDYQIANYEIVPIQALSFKKFFVHIAVQSRQKVYKAAIKSQLAINPHPLDKYRTNCPLARLELFKSIYNVKKGDKMYWNSPPIW